MQFDVLNHISILPDLVREQFCTQGIILWSMGTILGSMGILLGVLNMFFLGFPDFSIASKLKFF